MLAREAELLKMVEEREAERTMAKEKIRVLERREEELMHAAARWERDREAWEAERKTLEGGRELLKEEWASQWRLAAQEERRAAQEASDCLARERDTAFHEVCLRLLSSPHIPLCFCWGVCMHVCVDCMLT